jgi:SAM-dependent methyltransferase
MKGNTNASPEWQSLLEELASGKLLQASFSSPRRKDIDLARKVTVRPVSLKGSTHYQFESFRDNKAFHDNVPEDRLSERLEETMAQYKQALFKTPEADVQVLANKKGQLTLIAGTPTVKPKTAIAEHNRKKSYVISEGDSVPYLIELGVMTGDGRVVKAKYDKFRQINRFLEMVSDVITELPRDRELTIVDFGCGKSYLTFAMYHLLAVKEGLPVRMIGLDLKRDVIEACAELARKLEWDKLSFAVGDISHFEGLDAVDMVVTLHACDTATDAALLKAIGWQANVILSVPCCQHELFNQISQPTLKPLLKHGILKERFTALVTDAVRANLLETAGYRTQLLEFIDLEHTPKNLLIRAVKGRKEDGGDARIEYERFRDFLSIDPFMEKNFDNMTKVL